MLKSTSIHNSERLTHFLTSQLEYVDGMNVVLDLFQRRRAENIGPKVFQLTVSEKAEHLKFREGCFKKVLELHSYLACDAIVSGLADSSDYNNENITPLSVNESDMPSERVLKKETVLPKTVQSI